MLNEDVVGALKSGDPKALMLAGANAIPMHGVMAQVSKATSALGIDKDSLMALASGDPAALIEVATKTFKVRS